MTDVYGHRYEVIERVGDGGMATVYRGMDRLLKREVAIKVMHPHLASRTDARARFNREAQAIARLKHPNIVDVYDFSVGSEEEAFLVTEFVHGTTLTQFVQAHGPFYPQVAALLGHAMAAALGHAHAVGIVHRDIKPDNLMVSRDGQLKLMDFGIATAMDLEQMTATGAIVGSPAHMGPEQIEGGQLDHRCDVFAYGIVLYFLVTRRLPFQASNPHALFRLILECRYDLPSKHNPAVDRTFDGIVQRCLQRRREDRYANMAELQAALIAYLKQFRMSDVGALLPRFLKAPEVFQFDLKPTLVQRITEEGRRYADAGQLAFAIEAFNRALVLDPEADEPKKGLSLLTSRSRRRRRLKRAMLAVAAAAVLALALWAAWEIRQSAGETVPQVPPLAAVVAGLPRLPLDQTARLQASERDELVRRTQDIERRYQELKRKTEQVPPTPVPTPPPEVLGPAARPEPERRERKVRDRPPPPVVVEAGPATPPPLVEPTRKILTRLGAVPGSAALMLGDTRLGVGYALVPLAPGRHVVRCVPADPKHPKFCPNGCGEGQLVITVPDQVPAGGQYVPPINKCRVTGFQYE